MEYVNEIGSKLIEPIKVYNKEFQYYEDGKYYEIKIKWIKVDPQTRVRGIPDNYEDIPEFKTLKETMESQGLINPLTVSPNLDLIEGFIRYSFAFMLKWKRIIVLVKDFTEEEAQLWRMAENEGRIPLTLYEKYMEFSRLLDIFGKIKAKEDTKSSFGERYKDKLGMTIRSIRRRKSITIAIREGMFSEKTIFLLKQGKITQNKLISILQKITLQKEKELKKKERQQKRTKKEIKEKINNMIDSGKTIKFETHEHTEKKKVQAFSENFKDIENNNLKKSTIQEKINSNVINNLTPRLTSNITQKNSKLNKKKNNAKQEKSPIKEKKQYIHTYIHECPICNTVIDTCPYCNNNTQIDIIIHIDDENISLKTIKTKKLT